MAEGALAARRASGARSTDAAARGTVTAAARALAETHSVARRDPRALQVV